MTGRPETFLAFDYGDKRIGVAVGQSLTGTATPLRSVSVRDREPDWDVIARLVSDWLPDALVVGLPLNMDGSEQIATHSARRFTRKLAARFALPVHFADERLTTVEAKRRLEADGRAGEDDDPVAAQVILEAWLAGQQARS